MKRIDEEKAAEQFLTDLLIDEYLLDYHRNPNAFDYPREQEEVDAQYIRAFTHSSDIEFIKNLH